MVFSRKKNAKRKRFILVLAVSGAAVLLVWLLGGSKGLDWRLDAAATYLRGILRPVAPLPTAAATSAARQDDSPLPAPALPTAALLLPTPGADPSPAAVPTAAAPLPEKVVLPPPAIELQDWNNCGPATLAMYLRFYGWEGDQKTIAAEIKPISTDRNTAIQEMAGYVRRRVDWLESVYRFGGDIDLLRRIVAAGMPVMIEEVHRLDRSFWPNDDRWSAHYLLITGYDDARQVFISQNSFTGADQMVNYNELELNWQPFNHLYLLLYRPQDSQAVKELLAEDWEVGVNQARALEKARAEAKNNPQNTYAWFNLGSSLLFFERYPEAALAYDQARRLGWPQRMLRYQFGPFEAYYGAGRIDDLLTLTAYALERTPNSEEALFWQGLGFSRSGKAADARRALQKALDAHPSYRPALEALASLQTNQEPR